MDLVCPQFPIQWVNVFFSGGKEAEGMKLITSFHLVRGLIVSVSISSLSLHLFMTWPETALPLLSFTLGIFQTKTP